MKTINLTSKTAMRPLAERITQGSAVFDIEAVHAAKPNCFLITDGTQDPLRGIAVVCIHKEHLERIANAELITEAFNVTYETGKTPRQLADEVTRLRSALAAAVDRMEAVAEGIPVHLRAEGVSQATHVAHMAGHLAQHAKIARNTLNP